MKILKAGTLPPPVDIVEVFQGTCFNCNAQIEAERSEVEFEYQWYHCKCPTIGCNKGILLNRIVTEIPRAC
jgi:hypothetical protein